MTMPDLTLDNVKKIAEKKREYRASDFLTAEQVEEVHKSNIKGKKNNSFDSIDFIYKNDIKINGNLGCFKFFQYSFDDFSEHVLYDGNYYQLLVYATTMEKANIHFYFDEETQTFTIEADKEISNIFIEVTTKDNSSVETVCPEDIKGNKFTITINEDCTANVEIK